MNDGVVDAVSMQMAVIEYEQHKLQAKLHDGMREDTSTHTK